MRAIGGQVRLVLSPSGYWRCRSMRGGIPSKVDAGSNDDRGGLVIVVASL